jgi:hypothetical protein
MTTPIKRPSASVKITKATTTTPTYAPQLPACVVGPCRSELPLYNSTGSLNDKAKVSVPALIVGTDTDATKSVAGLSLKVSVGGGSPQVYTFPSFQSPTSFAMKTSMIATLLDANISGVTVSRMTSVVDSVTQEQIVFKTVDKGDAASLQILKSNIRVKYTPESGWAPQLGWTLYNSSDNDYDVGQVVALDEDNLYMIIDWTGPSRLPQSGDTLSFDGDPSAYVEWATSVAHELGVADRFNLVIEGADNYTNQDVAIPYNGLPSAFGSADSLVFNEEQIALYRSQNGTLRRFETDSTTLMNRKVRAYSTGRAAHLLVGSNLTSNSAIYFTSAPGLNGSEITITLSGSGANPSVSVSGKRITVTFSGGDFSANDIANAINTSTEAASLVRAYPCSNGNGNCATCSETHLVPNRLAINPSAKFDYTGYPINDGDTDSVTPYFAAVGRVAKLELTNLTFTARGYPNGSYHGTNGNNISVTIVYDNGLNAYAVDVSDSEGTALYIRYGNGTTLAQLTAAVNSSSVTSPYVVCSYTGTGNDGAYEVDTSYLYGGVDPLGFTYGEEAAVVAGERTDFWFKTRKIAVKSITGDIIPGNTVYFSYGGPDLNCGVLVYYDSTNSTLYTYDGGEGTSPNVGTTLNIDGTECVVVSVAEPGVADGDILSLKFDTFGGEDANVVNSQLGQTISISFSSTTDLSSVRDAINDAVSAVYTNTHVAYLKHLDDGFGVQLDSSATPAATLWLDLSQISTRKGLESSVTISGSAAEKIFGMMPGGSTFTGIHEGRPYVVRPGDELYDGTTLLGRIIGIEELKIGSSTYADCKLRISTDTLPISKTYGSWWVKATGLTVTDGYVDQSGGYDRPLPSLVIDPEAKALYVTQNQARNLDGTPILNANYPLYITYNALRKDVSAAETKELITIDNVDDITLKLGEPSLSNPLALGVLKAVENAPNLRVYALGVSDDSDYYGEGTYAAYKEAFELIESKGMYAISALTYDKDVGTLLTNRCETISDPDGSEGSPCISVVCERQPTEKAPTLVASGLATLTDNNELTFSNMINLEEMLTDAGVDPSNSWSEFKDVGLYARLSTSPGRYSVLAVDGNVVTLAASAFDPGENDDRFYTTTSLDTDASPPAVDPLGETVSLYTRGASIDASTALGRGNLSQALADAGQEFVSSRRRFIQPDEFEVTIPGAANAIVPGYYAGAALVGLMSSTPAFKSLTGSELRGFVKAIGSNDKLTETNLNLAAGGGVWWFITEDGIVKTRHQLTTDVSTQETKQCSIVRVLDFVAIYFKRILKAQVESASNIDNNFLTHLGIICDGVMGRLVTSKYLTRGRINRIYQDPDNPVGIIIEGTAKPPYPCDDISFRISV